MSIIIGLSVQTIYPDMSIGDTSRNYEAHGNTPTEAFEVVTDEFQQQLAGLVDEVLAEGGTDEQTPDVALDLTLTIRGLE